jgi:hypothetical protein
VNEINSGLATDGAPIYTDNGEEKEELATDEHR